MAQLDIQENDSTHGNVRGRLQSAQGDRLERELELVQQQKEKLQLELEVLRLLQMMAAPSASATQGEGGQSAKSGASSGSLSKKRTIDWPQDFVPGQCRQHSFPDNSTLDSLGQRLINSAYAVSSQRNLNSHIKSYLSFCDAASVVPFPVTVTLVTRYVTYLVPLGCAYGTILNHLSSLKHMHKLLRHELTWDSNYRYKLLLRRAKRHFGTAVKRKAPITPRLLFAIAPLFF